MRFAACRYPGTAVHDKRKHVTDEFQSMKMTAILFILWAQAQAATLSGPPLDRDHQLAVQNTPLLSVSLGMDRDVYFPGEAARLSISVRNPTEDPLLVLEPFTVATGCIEILKKAATATYEPVGADSMCDNIEAQNYTPVTTFSGFEERERTSWSFEARFDLYMPLVDSGGVPAEPGEYAALYTYRARKALFRVVAPTLDASTILRLADSTWMNPISEKDEPLARYIRAFAVRWNNESFVCAGVFARSYARPFRTRQGDVFQSSAAEPASPYRRLATSGMAVTAISATSGEEETIKIVYTTSDGVKHTLEVERKDGHW